MNNDKENSGNVFADLGLADADDPMTNAHLAVHIRRTIEAWKLTHVQVPC